MRGLEEEKDEGIREKRVDILAELLEKTIEEVDKGLDLIYRVKSRYVERKGIPQDMIINCMSKVWKEEILRQSYDNQSIKETRS